MDIAYCQFSQEACTNFMQTYLYLLISTHFFILTTNLHWKILKAFFTKVSNYTCAQIGSTILSNAKEIKKLVDINEYKYVCIKLVQASWEN